jgi:hypothetical protein
LVAVSRRREPLGASADDRTRRARAGFRKDDEASFAAGGASFRGGVGRPSETAMLFCRYAMPPSDLELTMSTCG